MKKAVIFGAGQVGKKLYSELKDKYNITCFTDNNFELWGRKLFSIPIVKVDDISEMTDHYIIVANHTGVEVVYNQLIDLGVDKNKIITKYVEEKTHSRDNFLKDFSKLVYENNIQGSVAEAGVFQGQFAKKINEYFYDRKIYLFDTFEGFDIRDLEYEEKKGYETPITETSYSITSEEIVLKQMPNVHNCIIKKGYFPSTTEGIEESFCFVNLDMDLYKPILDGLEYFYPRMNKGGVIIIHDYFNEKMPGVKNAVKDFVENNDGDIHLFTIGDEISIGIVI